MPTFKLNRNRTKKPDDGFYEIDWSNRLTKGLKHLFILTEDGHAPYDLVTKTFMSGTVGTPFGGADELGRNLSGDGGDAYYTNVPVYQHPITIAAIGSKISKAGSSTLFGLGEDSSLGGMFILSPRSSSTNDFRVYVRSISGQPIQWLSGAPNYSVDQNYLLASTIASGNDARFWVDGKFQSQNTGNHGNTLGLDRLTLLGLTRDTPGASHDGSISFAAVWNTDFFDEDHAELANNPWALLKSKTLWVEQPEAGAITGTITSDFDSLIQAESTLTTTIDALIQKQSTVSGSTDAIIQSSSVTTSNLDALIQATFTATTTIDALLQKEGAIVALMDAVIQSPNSVVSTFTDALIQKTGVISAGNDAVLQVSSVVTTAADAVLQKTVTISGSLDAVVQQEGATLIAASTDALIQKTNSISGSTDALVQQIDNVVTSSFDSIISKTNLITSSLDALITSPGNVKFSSLDALVQKTQTITSSLDSFLQVRKTNVTNYDALIASTNVLNSSLDAIIEEISVVSGSLDALIMRQGEVVVSSLDAIISNGITVGSVVAKVNIYASVDGSATLDPGKSCTIAIN